MLKSIGATFQTDTLQMKWTNWKLYKTRRLISSHFSLPFFITDSIRDLTFDLVTNFYILFTIGCLLIFLFI